ncbi:differentially expressed in FDCP 8 homolog [Macrosteles quadrilineatus]|uniref:differentially expressed in FDCP 8 homolog n=1 Tax=Macrosteles quadrilineatus TaxID=74068 RepID=UPI0023E32ABA|nr:differentially expressed in FDCP 8 homolog [Macrosteles quadrilineatus]XP_054276398.1 differentially expressed in FDCP 8 homolog [Macrosteles quadrilineatus]
MNKENEKSVLPSTSVSSSPSSGKLTDHGDESESEDSLSVPASLIGAENYLTLTEGKLHSLTKDELTEAACECKKLILDSAVCSNERKWLVRRLIELRYQLLTVEEAKEVTEPVATEPAKSRIVLGHHLELRYHRTSTTKRYCDTCCSAIWNILQCWYQCSDCRYRCHDKCVEQIVRPCPQLVASEKPKYETSICPEVGLAAQNYQCAECKLPISFKNSWLAPRLCDYTGLYYCTSCHWNNSSMIPARVVCNWDFKPYLVCRATYQLLRYTRNRPLLRPDLRLFGFVKELAEIKRLREELSLLKVYLVRCREAREEKKVLWKLFGNRSHLLEPTDIFSLRDFTELNSGTLLGQMKTITNEFTEHITKNCAICSGQGYICELCDDKDNVIFPFYSNVHVCSECSWVYHKTCWLRTLTCRKCERNKRKSQENLDSNAPSADLTIDNTPSLI